MEHAALTGVDLIFPGAAAMMPALPPTASRPRPGGGGRRFHDSAGNNRQAEMSGARPPGVAVMNNWVFATILFAAAVFMYVSIIIKMSE